MDAFPSLKAMTYVVFVALFRSLKFSQFGSTVGSTGCAIEKRSVALLDLSAPCSPVARRAVLGPADRAAPEAWELLLQPRAIPPGDFVKFFAPQTFTDRMRIQPLLTPDPGVYSAAVLALIQVQRRVFTSRRSTFIRLGPLATKRSPKSCRRSSIARGLALTYG
jgi:hypothetical protein